MRGTSDVEAVIIKSRDYGCVSGWLWDERGENRHSCSGNMTSAFVCNVS